MKKFFIALRGVALIAGILAFAGLGDASQEKKQVSSSLETMCLESGQSNSLHTLHQEEETDFFIVGCGGFI